MDKKYLVSINNLDNLSKQEIIGILKTTLDLYEDKIIELKYQLKRSFVKSLNSVFVILANILLWITDYQVFSGMPHRYLAILKIGIYCYGLFSTLFLYILFQNKHLLRLNIERRDCIEYALIGFKHLHSFKSINDIKMFLVSMGKLKNITFYKCQ